MRKDNKRFIIAWGLFLFAFVVFIIWTKWSYDSEKEKGLKYQCKIIINDEIIKDTEIVEKDIPEIVPQKEIQEDLNNDDRKFYEHSKYGDLPKISPDGMRVLDAYSAKRNLTEANKIFLVIQLDAFVSKESLYADIQMLGNKKVTFVIPHYHNDLAYIVNLIRENGHEFLLQLPTQSSIPEEKRSSVSPFLANTERYDLIEKLQCLLASTKYAIGIANTSTTLFTKSQRDMSVIEEELSKRGLAFFNVEKSDIVPQISNNFDSILYATADVEISDSDVINADNFVNNMIVFVKFSSLNRFMEEFTKKTGFEIAPVSQFLRK